MSGQPLPPSAQEVARWLLALERPPGASKDATAAAAHLQQLCTRVTGNLADTMGADGCAALLARALARTEGAHPVLTNVRRNVNGGIALDGVAAAVESHGIDAVTTALEALFTALMDVLSRLIGEDMALRVLLPDSRPESRDETSS